MKTIAHGLIACTLASVVLFVGLAVAQVSITDLGTLEGTSSEALAVNNRGQVVGSSATDANQTRPFLWTIEDGMEDLGTLGGDEGEAVEINELGQVVGWSKTTDGDTHAFLWGREGGLVDLGTPAGWTSEATDINNRGEVVGFIRMGGDVFPLLQFTPFFWSPDSGIVDLEIPLGDFDIPPSEAGKIVSINDAGEVAFGQGQGFLWTEAGGLVEIESLGGSQTTVRAINNLGQVTGSSDTASQLTHPFVWSEQSGVVDLGTIGGPNAEASAINDRGEVTGGSQTTIVGQFHLFLWSAAEGMADLGSLPGDRSFGFAINELGHVAGFAEIAPRNDHHALLWTREDGLVDLGTLGGSFSEAGAINDLDQTVGSSATPSGDRHATLWGETDIADLWLEQSVLPLAGGTIRLTLTGHSAAGCRAAEPEVCGFGATVDAENVVLIDPLPLNPGRFEVVSLPPPCGYQRSTHTVTCQAALLPRDSSVSLAIEVRVRGPSGNFVNTAMVSSDTFDPNPDNNTASIPLTVD